MEDLWEIYTACKGAAHVNGLNFFFSLLFTFIMTLFCVFLPFERLGDGDFEDLFNGISASIKE